MRGETGVIMKDLKLTVLAPMMSPSQEVMEVNFRASLVIGPELGNNITIRKITVKE